jgi:hypothetical protein
MAKWDVAANEIFLQYLEIDSPEFREEYLDDACGGDTELRAEVKSLLAAHENAGNFLECVAPIADIQAVPRGGGRTDRESPSRVR